MSSPASDAEQELLLVVNVAHAWSSSEGRGTRDMQEGVIVCRVMAHASEMSWPSNFLTRQYAPFPLSPPPLACDMSTGLPFVLGRRVVSTSIPQGGRLRKKQPELSNTLGVLVFSSLPAANLAEELSLLERYQREDNVNIMISCLSAELYWRRKVDD